MAPQILQLQEIEPSAELAAALSVDFLCRLGIENPPPVRISTPPESATWRGYCSSYEFSEYGEVVLADLEIVNLQKWRMIDQFRCTYVHEAAHRLLSEADVASHGAEFLSLFLFLFFRAGEREKEMGPWWHMVNFYCMQDCYYQGLGRSLAWAWDTAQDLLPEELTAEQAVEEICKRAKAWLAEAPARREAAHEKQEALQVTLEDALNKIFWWRIYFAISSFFALIFCGISFYLR